MAVSTATGGPWMVTVANAGALCTPRLSVTTSEKVTVPVVLGTVTATLEVGAFVVVDGFDGESATGVPVGAGVGEGVGVGIGIGVGSGPTGATGPATGPEATGVTGVVVASAGTAGPGVSDGVLGVFGIFFLRMGSGRQLCGCTRVH